MEGNSLEIATKRKEENESQNLSVSDGEIVSEGEEEVHNSPISIPLRKLQKNFRSRHSGNSDDSDREDGLIFEKKSDGNKCSIENGDEKYLQNVRKKIMDELKDKDDGAKKNDKHSRSNNFFRDDQFKKPSNFDRSERNRRHTDNFRQSDSNRSFRRNSFHDRRENGKNKTDLFEVRSRQKGTFHIYFPKKIIKYTKTQPSISFAENPRVNQKSKEESRASTSSNKSEDKGKVKLKKERRRSRSKDRTSSSHEKSSRGSSKPKHLPKPKIDNVTVEQKSSKTEIKLEEVEVEDNNSIKQECEGKVESPEISYSPIIKKEPSPEKELDNGSLWKLEEHTPEHREIEEKVKFEPIIIERKKIRKIEKPKVNIFLEDSDEVDEFENTTITLEVKSKWSSPDPPKLPDIIEDELKPAIVPRPLEIQMKEIKSNIPVVVDSPERSPITTGSLTDSIFDTSSSISKSSTPQIKNVCSFLTDIESEGYLSGFDLENALYSDNEDAPDVEKLIAEKGDSTKNTIFTLNQEPDTTAEKIEIKLIDDKSDLDSDSDDESSSESSSSSSSDSSESSEESSDESSDDETSKIVNIFTGFGRFDATSMPMVTQIKPIVTQTNAGSAENATTRFQPQQSIIKPPGLVTNLTKLPHYTPSACISTPTTPFAATPPFGQTQFPIPFKIYSLKDASNNGMVYGSIPPTPVAAPVVIEKDIKEKEREKDKEPKREKEKEKEREKEREKRPEKREREKHRSRSHSRERDRKKLKEERRDYDRRKTPPKRRTPSPRRRSISPRRKHTDDKRDTKRREFSPKHRLSHNSRHSPIRRIRRSRTPPSRGRSPQPKVRKISPVPKYRRSSSPRSISPIYRPRRRYSPSSNNDQNHSRRTPSRSPPDRYDDRRSYSPTFRKMESPSGYKPDSTISDTELERQQQFSQMGDYYSWNQQNMPSHSPRRPNLDDRINRMLSDSPIPAQYQQDGSYPYPHQQIHDNPPYIHQQINHHNHQEFYYSDIYSSHNQSLVNNIDVRYHPPSSMMNNHAQQYEENFNAFSSPRNFVNNSNLVEITQQKREKQRVGSNQIAVQVGNVLEIVPSNEIPATPLPVQPVLKPLSPEEERQQAEKKEQMKIRRKAERERKRMAKYLRKEKLRQEIQKYFDAGINIEDSDDETLIKLRPVNVTAVADRGIIKKTKVEEKSTNSSKKVLFKDGVMPGETSSDNELPHENEQEKKVKLRRKRLRKKRLNQIVKERKKNIPTNEIQIIVQKQDELDAAPPPLPPQGAPPAHLKQPRLKNITPDMFAAFSVNLDPIYYHIHKTQRLQLENSFQMSSRNYRYQKFNDQNKHPSNMQYPPNYSQQRYCAPPKPLNSMDPRINQQRTAEKIFA